MSRTFLPHVITDDSALGGSVIQRSLRFNDNDSPYLERTPSGAGSNQMTFSFWIKRGNLALGSQAIFSSGENNARGHIYFDSSDQLNCQPFNSSSANTNLVVARLFRDPAAWYHVVLSFNNSAYNDTASTVNVYVNGVSASFTPSVTNTPTGGNRLNDSSGKRIGEMRPDSGSHFDGYLAEFNFIDGQVLDSSYFGFTDPVTGIWMPKRYEGTYGTNGFYLDFSDNSSTATLGIDKSPNGNDFSLSNLTVTDSVLDTPSNNFATWSKVDHEGRELTLSEGNLKVYHPYQHKQEEGGATLAFSSGKWYWEEYMVSSTADASNIGVGVKSVEGIYTYGGNHWRVRGNGGETDHNGTQTNISGFSWTTGDIIGIAVDMDAGTWTVSKNGTFIGSNIHTNLSGTVVPVTHNSNSGENHTFIANFGQDSSFAGTKTAQGNKDSFGIGDFYYAVPSGYRALCSKNLFSTATSIVRPQKHFDILTYTGDQTDGTRSITGLEFTPDFVWLKCRSSATSHNIYDSVRGFGANKEICSDKTQAEGGEAGSQYGYVNQNSRGFDLVAGSDSTLGSRVYNININSATYVAWCWKAGGAAVANSDGNITSQVSVNEEAGFSIISYTGNNTDNATVGHGLGKTPAFLITKSRDNVISPAWHTSHVSLPTNYDIALDSTDAAWNPSTNGWHELTNSSVFTLKKGSSDGNNTNRNGDRYITYCWAEISGYSKFGSYIGTGTAQGPHVFTGFKPAWVLTKRSGGTSNWNLFDYKRPGYNPTNDRLFPNLSNAEIDGSSSNNQIRILSTGFKPTGSNVDTNGAGSEYIYMAFAEQPTFTPFGTQSNPS